MVVLGAAIVNKTGKVLLSRHFVEMHRVRIEGLLAAFPKLIGTGAKQHTFVETESVRYVYQPMDSLFLLIITNKSSNIIEDLETLRLLAKLIPEYCTSVDEDGIGQAQFKLIFAFDEALALGYRENVKPEQIRTYTEMDSHEEKLFLMIQQHKEDEQRKEAARIASLIGSQGQKYQGTMGGISSSSSGTEVVTSSQQAQITYDPPTSTSAPAKKTGPRVTGMTLGGKTTQNKTTSLLKNLQNEGELKDEVEIPRPTATVQKTITSESVNIAVEEKVKVKLDREGGLESVEVLGSLSLLINDPQYAFIRLHCTPLASLYQLKTNPKVNKDSFSSSALVEPSDTARGFPLASSQVLLKWRMVPSMDETKVPLIVNCWPSQIDGGYSVNLDFDLTMKRLTLTNVIITVPLGAFGSTPRVIQSDGDAVFNPDNSSILWHLSSINASNSTGTLEFEVFGPAGSDSIFPITVSFSSDDSHSGFQVQRVENPQSSDPVPFSLSSVLCAEQYLIV